MSFFKSKSAHTRIMNQSHEKWKKTGSKKANISANYHAVVITKMNQLGRKLTKQEKKTIYKSNLNY